MSLLGPLAPELAATCSEIQKAADSPTIESMIMVRSRCGGEF